MSVKFGWGTIRQLMVYSVGADRNAVIVLPKSDADKRIRNITYSYGRDTSDLAAAFAAGRLIVCWGKFDAVTQTISPSNSGKIDDNSSFNSLFDHNLSLANGQFNFGDEGILIPKSLDVSVILTAPETTGDAPPVFDSMVVGLTVNGIDLGLPNPFPRTR